MKEIVLTEQAIATYRSWGIEVKCRTCGHPFEAGDRILKGRLKRKKEPHDQPFYCLDHAYSESDPLIH